MTPLLSIPTLPIMWLFETTIRVTNAGFAFNLNSCLIYLRKIRNRLWETYIIDTCLKKYAFNMERQYKCQKCASAVFREYYHRPHSSALLSPSPPCLIWTYIENLRFTKLSAPTHWAATTIHQFLFIPCSSALACSKIKSSPISSTSSNSNSGRQRNYQLSRTTVAPAHTMRSYYQLFLSLPSYNNTTCWVPQFSVRKL